MAWTRIFVLAAWFLLSAGDFWLVWAYGCPLPYMDDFGIVRALTGHIEHVPEWLWSQHNEHRLPVPRLVLWGLVTLSGGDFRAAMVFNAAALSAISLLLIETARSVRGRTSYADLFLPIVLLHPGHWNNLLWAWQVGFILVTCLAYLLIREIVMAGPAWTWPQAARASAYLILMPLCGGVGVALTPALAIWFIACALLARKPANNSRLPALILIAGGLAALGLVFAYFVDYRRPPQHPVSPDQLLTLSTSSRFIGMGLGAFDNSIIAWPILAFILVGACWVIGGCIASPAASAPAAGMLAMGAGIALMALGIGWSRAAVFPYATLPPRYVTLASIAMVWSYFALLIAGKWPARWLTTAMACAGLLTLEHNITHGLTDASIHGRDLEYIRQDLAKGGTINECASRYSQNPCRLYPNERDLRVYLTLLHEAGIRDFRNVGR